MPHCDRPPATERGGARRSPPTIWHVKAGTGHPRRSRWSSPAMAGNVSRPRSPPLVPTGGRCGVEALTYPFVKGIAARLGVTLVPLAMDEHGVRPDAVQKAHREAHLSALYVQPIIQNPLGMTMPACTARRSLARRRKARSHRHRGHGLRLSGRRAAAGGAGAGPLHRARQPLQEGRAGAVARLCGAAAAPARKRHRFGALGRLDGVGICVRGRATVDGRRHRRRTCKAEADRCAAAPADRRRLSFRLRNPDQQQVLSSLADIAAALAIADICRRRRPARYCPDALDDIRGQPWPRAQRRPAGLAAPADRATRGGPAHAGGHVEREGRGFRFRPNRSRDPPLTLLTPPATPQ